MILKAFTLCIPKAPPNLGIENYGSADLESRLIAIIKPSFDMLVNGTSDQELVTIMRHYPPAYLSHIASRSRPQIDVG